MLLNRVELLVISDTMTILMTFLGYDYNEHKFIELTYWRIDGPLNWNLLDLSIGFSPV